MPWTRKSISFSRIASSLVVIAPASPKPPRFLEGKNEKQPSVPSAPARLPRYSAPTAWAASSTTAIQPRGDGVDRIHVRALTVEMHRHDRARTPADLLLDLRRIDVVVLEAHVDEYRTRAEAMHDSGGRKEGVRRHDHFVALPDAEDHQRLEQRI